MYHPWNLGGLNPAFFGVWGGLAPPSPYVEPPLGPGSGMLYYLNFFNTTDIHGRRTTSLWQSTTFLSSSYLVLERLSSNLYTDPTEVSTNALQPTTLAVH